MNELDRIARGCTDFGFRLYRRLDGEGNRFFSPMSVAVALAALLAGARGETKRELAAALGLEDDELAGMSELVRGLATRRAVERDWDEKAQKVVSVERDQFVLRMANALFVQRSYPLRDDYLAKTRDWFQSASIATEFSHPDTAAALVNGWVAERTEGRIQKLIDPIQLDAGTRLVIVNAIYFFAQWLEQFEESATRPAPFHVSADRSRAVEVPTMRMIGDFRHFEDRTIAFEAASLPYKAMSMLVILPDHGTLASVEAILDTTLLERIARGLAWRDLELALPKFEMECRFELATALSALGVKRIFSIDAELGGITDDPAGLYVTSVVHQANITVDENGTEAAAATAGMLAAGAAFEEPPKPHPFIVDRPFLFVIWDEPTHTVLFAGRVTDPSVAWRLSRDPVFQPVG